MDYKDIYKKLITDWAVENGAKREETEGVDSLAEYLADRVWQVGVAYREQCELEDIEVVAENKDIELTEAEKQEVLHRFEKVENQAWEVIDIVIDEVKGAKL